MSATSQSVFPRLEPLLPTVQKPIQYVGGELNSTVKEWDCARRPSVRWALMYPDAYEVGLPNQGVADPLRGAQRARLDPGRAHVLRVARHGDA